MKDCEVIQQFLLIDKWRSVVDVVFLFLADPETSMERENRERLIVAPGRAMNPTFLAGLYDAYQAVQSKYEDRFRKFHVIKTDKSLGTTPQSTSLEVAREIISLWREVRA